MEDVRAFGGLGRLVAGRISKWVTLLVWVIVVAVLTVAGPQVTKMENNTAPNRPLASQSVQADQLARKLYPSSGGDPALLVWYNPSGLSKADYQDIAAVSKNLAEHPLVGQQKVVPLYKVPSSVLPKLASKTGDAIVDTILFAPHASTTTLQNALTTLRARVGHTVGRDVFTGGFTSPGLHARITGPVGIAVDALGLFKGADIALLAATTMLVFILLILLYRSPLLPFIPLIAVGFAYATVSPLLGILARAGVIQVGAEGVSIMTVLLFGAGTDYCLFIVARYRDFLRRESDRHTAMRKAVGGAGGAVVMSGLTVAVSLCCLLLAQYGAEHRFAVPFAVAVAIMALAGVTLVPALLAIFGRASFFPFIPRTPELQAVRDQKRRKPVAARKSAREGGRFGRWIGRTVVARPWAVIVGALVVLGIFAGFSSQIGYTYSLISSFPKTMQSREGFTILEHQYAPGELAPVQVLVKDAPAAPVMSALKQLPFVASVGTAQRSTVDPHYLSYQVILKQDPYSMSSMADMSTLRGAVQKAIAAGGIRAPATHVAIAGQTEAQASEEYYVNHDIRVVIPVVIGVIALLLLAYLRSIVAAIYLIATVLLSFFSALGAGWLIIHYGLGASAMNGAIPLYAFVFLVALGEDYNIFMVSRIWQGRRDRPIGEAISSGVSQTAGVITSAGLILAGTFAVLASLPIQILVQFGIVAAIGVLLDTFVVRPFLVPSITAVLGDRAFWPMHPKRRDMLT